MTLILALGNTQQVALVSDRRFSYGSGFVDDEKNKAAILHCLDGRAAIAFTGLAEIPGRFRTNEWMLIALQEASKSDCLLESTIRRFTDIATHDIGKLPISDKRRALTFVFAGYKFDEAPPRNYFWRVTNFETKDGKQLSNPMANFECYSQRESRPAPVEPHFVLAAGTTAAIGNSDWNELVALVQVRKPAVALVNKAVGIIRAAADSHLSGGSVGKQCNSIVLPRDRRQSASAAYHSSVVSYDSYAPSQVVCMGERRRWIIRDPSFEFRDSAGHPVPMALPKVKRNQPCPCGSGKKYKQCHGKPSGI